MKKLILSILCVSVLFACRKLDQPITTDYTDAAYWQTQDDALAALASCYENLSDDQYYFGDEALSDNGYVSGIGYKAVSLIAAGAYDPSNLRVSDEWKYRYTCIRKCNIVTNNIDRIPTIDSTLKRRIVAEARFIRAYSYFQLATWFGDVPFYTNLITVEEARNITRSKREDVLSFVESELADIRAALPVNNYSGSAGYSDKDKGRITRGAAIALSARLHMFKSEWQKAITDCELLIGNAANGNYALQSSYANIFSAANEFNNEVIFDIQYGGGRTNSAQRTFMPQTVALLRSTLVPTQDLVDDYIMLNGRGIRETGSGYSENDPYTNRDPRMNATILHHGSTVTDFDGRLQTILTRPGSTPSTNSVDDQGASPTGYYFYKYYDRTATNYNSGLNLIVIRYADVLLMYAEAKNELGQLDAAVWNQTIRALRLRAGFNDAGATEFPGVGQDVLRTIIRRERRSELAFEGVRALDIRRWKIADQVMNRPVRGIKVNGGAFRTDANGYIIVEDRRFINPKHYLWPVPTFERDQNTNLGQNQDW
ncbi:RagB/SusD family nutrient uptake outer membrane protein [Chitinophaga rhizophila]|uniref:RagB/SusD family nutrient uptake outer membrane protein n=1 Tax=Chitinophaga rhizophila TaxID=2866212 RepID=A0ABS7G9I4_9BACT|nr:RagB/SusD family nutrient uptake outer membrane protein [Chitinophaga rhizophila]MBW8684323.1 RagB/SusD family nutrient uptake outer membrane protein [Chitinophaga rhizophila]